MFFDQLDERNAMVQSNLAFEELALTGLAGLGTGLASSSRISTLETLFLRAGCKWEDPNMSSHCLDDRNMMAESIIYFGHFWLLTNKLYELAVLILLELSLDNRVFCCRCSGW